VWSSCGSRYCTWFGCSVTRTLRMSVLHSTAGSSAFTLRLRYHHLSLLQLIVRSCKKCLLCFPTWNIVTCILCTDFAMAMHVLLLTNTKGVFLTERFHLGVYLLVFLNIPNLLTHKIRTGFQHKITNYLSRYVYIQGVPGGIDKTSGEYSLC